MRFLNIVTHCFVKLSNSWYIAIQYILISLFLSSTFWEDRKNVLHEK